MTGYYDNALAVFDRDTEAGMLSYSQTFSDDFNGGTIETFLGPQGIAVSPDGKNVYVAVFTDNALVVFDRNTDTGAVSCGTTITDSLTLSSPYGIAVSPDGANVYAASYGLDRLLVYTRNMDTGALIPLESHVNNENGVTNLDGPYWIAVSPDGKSVYVTARETDSLVAFNRDLDTGALSYSIYYQDGGGGVDGLDKPLGVTVSSCGGRVYVTGCDDSALTVFDR
jgi:DNA-binding beta-propeller fold protein YncE